MAADRDEVVRKARAVLEAEGPEALAKHRLADRESVEAAIVAQGLCELGDALSAAAIGADDRVAAVAAAYREYALAHPHVYTLATARPLRHDLLPPGTEQRAASPVLVAVGDMHRSRAFVAFAHGMCALELAGRFSREADLDAAWRAGVAAFSPTSGS